MEIIWNELVGDMPNLEQIVRVFIRLLAAAILGGIIGLQREQMDKPAGLRTHMLVSLGSAVLVLIPAEAAFDTADLSRIIQGIATGIGFIGGGAILKMTEKKEITGLTTAASIWMTAAIGVAVGLGRLGSAMLGVIMTWIILSLLWRIEDRISASATEKGDEQGSKERKI